MKTKYKRKWIKALRSGKYKQGTDYLKRGDEFCCLGVLCDLVKDELGADWEIQRIYHSDFVGEFLGCDNELPDDVAELVGLSDVVGSYRALFGNKPRSLAQDNDSGKTFKQIANIIERRF